MQTNKFESNAAPDALLKPSSWEQASLFPALQSVASPARAANEPVDQAADRANNALAHGHLRAARQLSRDIRAQKASRTKRAATGVAICGHLLALLEVSANDTSV